MNRRKIVEGLSLLLIITTSMFGAWIQPAGKVSSIGNKGKDIVYSVEDIVADNRQRDYINHVPVIMSASISEETHPKSRIVLASRGENSSLQERYEAVRQQKLMDIGSVSDSDDIGFIGQLIDEEKALNLPKGILLAVASAENGFTNNTVMDSGSLSYGTFQIKMAAAGQGQEFLESIGMRYPIPTDTLLRDREYNMHIAAGYIKYLTTYVDDNYHVFACYNMGITRANRYRDSHGTSRTPYSEKLMARWELFKNIIGQYY